MGKEKVIGDESSEQWKGIAIHDEEMVFGFFGPFRPLSNFWPAKVMYDGVIYPSSENAYQAAKFAHNDRLIFEHCSASEAKSYSGNPNRLYKDDNWKIMRLHVMESVLRDKFSERNPDLVRFLLDTQNKKLIEANWWGDNFFGVCRKDGSDTFTGENNLGTLLMQRRAYLQRNW
jgi:ribA/ribD-fused uncharacterized protein